MKVIVDVTDQDSVDDAIEILEDYLRWLDKVCEEIVERMAEKAKEIASSEYETQDYAGVKDFYVDYDISKEGSAVKATVYANGQSVLFMEFGTGLFKASAPFEVLDLVSGADAIVAHGTYGQGKASNPQGWTYYGSPGSNPPSGTYEMKGRDGVVRTMGNDASSAMWHAKKAMKDALMEAVMEVGRYDR